MSGYKPRQKPFPIAYECKLCGEIKPRSEYMGSEGVKKYVRCVQCRSGSGERYRSEVSQRHRLIHKPVIDAIRRGIVEAKGGCCMRCGYSEFYSGLCFHHINQDEKESSVHALIASYAHMPTRNKIEKIVSEANKCAILCANCHNALHSGEWSIDSLLAIDSLGLQVRLSDRAISRIFASTENYAY